MTPRKPRPKNQPTRANLMGGGAIIIPMLYEEYLEKVINMVMHAHRAERGNKTKMAERLGICRVTLSTWMKRHTPDLMDAPKRALIVRDEEE